MYVLSVSVTYLQLYTEDHKFEATNDDSSSDVVSKFEPVDVCSKRYSLELSQYPQQHYYEVLSREIIPLAKLL